VLQDGDHLVVAATDEVAPVVHRVIAHGQPESES
jgi:hypothetical protein